MMATDQRSKVKPDRLPMIMMLAGVALAMLSLGLLTVSRLHDSQVRWVIVATVAGFLLLGALATLIVLRGWLPLRMPAGYEKRQVEKSQWLRWYNSLIVTPIVLTVFAIITAIQEDAWRADGDAFHLVSAVAFLVLAGGSIANLPAGPYGKPGTPQRRFFDRLNDDLSVAHAGQAYRWGLYVALAGLVTVLVVATFVPGATPFAAIGALWLAAVTTLVRFGLLLMAAEPVPQVDQG
jgi:hypothetical protein